MVKILNFLQNFENGHGGHEDGVHKGVFGGKLSFKKMSAGGRLYTLPENPQFWFPTIKVRPPGGSPKLYASRFRTNFMYQPHSVSRSYVPFLNGESMSSSLAQTRSTLAFSIRMRHWSRAPSNECVDDYGNLTTYYPTKTLQCWSPHWYVLRPFVCTDPCCTGEGRAC